MNPLMLMLLFGGNGWGCKRNRCECGCCHRKPAPRPCCPPPKPCCPPPAPKPCCPCEGTEFQFECECR